MPAKLHPAALWAVAAFALLGASFEPAPASAQARRHAGVPAAQGALAARALPPVEGEVIVRFRADAATLRQHGFAPTGPAAKPAEVAAVLGKRAATLGARVGRTLEAGDAVGERTQVMRERGADAHALARRLAADSEVEWAEPNGRQRRQQAVPPNDPLYPFASRAPGGPDQGQWYLRPPSGEIRSSIDVETAWAHGFGSSSVVVAVLDTGVRFEHPDLGGIANGGRLLDGYDFVTDPTVAGDGDGRDADPSDPGDFVTSGEASRAPFTDCEAAASSWHGTATASLVGAAANNGIGMAGTAPGVRVLPVRVLGKCFGKDSDIQAAMRWAAGIEVPGVPTNAFPARVINMSLGSSHPCSASYQAVVDEVTARGTIIVAAAGNSAGEPVGTPASCAGVVAVAGLRHVGTKVGFSDLGAQVSVAAPGGNCVNVGQGQPCLYPILAALDYGLTTPERSVWSDSFDTTIGTSFASPLVAGVVGLMLSQNPALTTAQVRALLQSTARLFPTTGGGADAVACAAPAQGVQQLECYCPNAGAATYPLCGAGMLNAGAAVLAAAAGLVAVVETSPAAPQPGQAITLLSTGSAAAGARRIAAWQWTLVSGGGLVNGFTGAANQATATLSPSEGGTGTIVVKLTITDDAGASISHTAAIAVAVAAPRSDGSGGGSGGGAMSALWLLLLAAAALALERCTPRG